MKQSIATKVVKNKFMITACIMLSTIMEVMDGTIANVALPHMQGSLGASQEQISWVLTSYIVSAAVMMPLTGWLVGIMGIKRILLFCVAGFTFSSVLCGFACSLTQIVFYRVLQGICGAALVPLSQTILFSINPPEKHGQAMATWGLGVMVAPIFGPVIGGYITNNYSWEWIFLINLPIGIITFLGLLVYLDDDHGSSKKFDFVGFALFSIFIMSLQLFLDRGEQKDWFGSSEILTYALVGAYSLLFFIISSYKKKDAFIPLELFQNRNYIVSNIMIFAVGVILMSSVSITPQFLQLLIGYDVFDAGLLTSPRGIGVIFAMMIIGRNLDKIDIRVAVAFGILTISASLHIMSGFTIDVSKKDIVITGIMQGFGIGSTFVPLSTVALSTLNDKIRPQGAALHSLIRSIGGSIGISVLIFSISYNTRLNHAILSESLKGNSKNLLNYLSNVSGLADNMQIMLLEVEVIKQASLIAYLDAFKILSLISLSMLFLVPLLKPIKNQSHQSIDIH